MGILVDNGDFEIPFFLIVVKSISSVSSVVSPSLVTLATPPFSKFV